MRIVQISDTHVSRRHGPFRRNLDVVADWVRRQNADLIVNTGDLSMNGAVTADDLDDAAAWHVDLGAQALFVPGNHDVGDRPELRSDQVLDDARLTRFRILIGEDRWMSDLAGWRLVGLNAMLLGTGHREEAEQHEWLEAALQTTDPVALFLHKPLFMDDPEEGPKGYWTVAPEPRRRTMSLLARADLRLVASGHLHVGRTTRRGETAYVWGPSASFVCGESQTGVPGERRIGAVVHDFRPDGVRSRIEYLDDEAENLMIDPHLADIYPSPEALEAAR